MEMLDLRWGNRNKNITGRLAYQQLGKFESGRGDCEWKYDADGLGLRELY